MRARASNKAREGRRRCPVCSHPVGTPGAPGFPFCSPACKLVDLGRWLDGAYRIAGPPVDVATSDGEME